jgi:hypothetical protein
VTGWAHEIICPSHPLFFFSQIRLVSLSRKAVFVETIRDGLPVVDKGDVMGATGAWAIVT